MCAAMQQFWVHARLTASTMAYELPDGWSANDGLAGEVDVIASIYGEDAQCEGVRAFPSAWPTSGSRGGGGTISWLDVDGVGRVAASPLQPSQTVANYTQADGCLRICISIAPYGSDTGVHVTLKLLAWCPMTYPDSCPPALAVQRVRGFPRGDDDVAMSQIMEACASALEQWHEGDVMLYALVEAIREIASASNVAQSDGSAYDEMIARQRAAVAAASATPGVTASAVYSKEEDPSLAGRRRGFVGGSAAKEEDEVSKRRHGTPVTREAFNEWRIKFERDLALEKQRRVEEEARAAGKEVSDISVVLRGRATGKQMFEADSSLAMSDVSALEAEEGSAADTPVADASGAGGAATSAGAGGLVIDETLFMEDDADLDDLGDEDEDDEDYEDDEDEDEDEEDAE